LPLDAFPSKDTAEKGATFRVARFSLTQYTKTVKKIPTVSKHYQMIIKYIYQMADKYSNWP
jgi:hypothetical protein